MGGMSQTSLAISTSIEDTSQTTKLLAGVSLCSFSALLLELGLTRLFSVVLFYHFAFLAISIALLGLGAGGVLAYVRRDWLARFSTPHLLSRLCDINTVVIPAVLIVILRIPVSLALTPANFLRLTVMYLAAAIPFFMTGLAFSVIFSREPVRIPQLYGADLLGGAMACMATVPLLNWIGGPNAILFSAAAVAFAGAAWTGSGRSRLAHFIRAAIVVLVIVGNYSGRLIDVVYAKGVLRDRSWVEFAKWNAISRVEVDPQGGGSKAIVIDADASTYIMNADPLQWKGTKWEQNLMSAPPALANVLRPHGTYAIIGPGGGVDVLRAVANGSPSVTGIEINPIIANTIMRDRYADFAHHLYQRPEVHIHVTDGRSFVRNSKDTYDVVQMTLVDTWASTAAGAFALSENNLYTVEAFQEYFRHLRPDGMLVITRWEFRQPREALRVVSLAMEALHRLGVADTSRHFVVVSDGPLDDDGIPVAVLAKKSPFTPEEENAVRTHLEDYSDLVAQHLPSQPGDNPFSRLIASNDPAAFARRYAYNVTPVFDNAPFFFFTLKLSQILGRGALERGIDWKVNLGVAVLGIVLLISIAAVLLFLILPLAMRSGLRQSPSRLFYFVVVGLGYILVEIAFIQRFVLFLGHPTYALTVVIFLMLLSSGAGSLVSRRWRKPVAAAWIPIVVIVVVLAGYVFFLPRLLNALVGLRFAVKLLVSGIILIPLGFAMGMPFPSGLRAVAGRAGPGQSKDNVIEWAWAMNAASSVLGSVLAMMIAIQYGLNVTLACGALAYLLALFLLGTLSPGMGEVRASL
jgi:SAM-dependent methyltransferase